MTLQSAASDLALLAAAAREAGSLVRNLFRQPLDVRSKGAEGPVTNIDLAVNDLLRDMLRGARPDYGWLSEEDPDEPDQRMRAARTFMLDPIDGTAALVARMPQFTISIGVVEGQTAVVGAVYNPLTDELFLGAADTPATLNGAPVRASTRAALEGARMVADKRRFAANKWPTPWPSMEIFQRQSIAYRLGLVGSGQADATVLFGAKNDWDIAAGAAIVAAAGGAITDPWGERLRLNQPVPRAPGVVAAGASLHPLLIERTSFLPDPRKAHAS